MSFSSKQTAYLGNRITSNEISWQSYKNQR